MNDAEKRIRKALEPLGLYKEFVKRRREAIKKLDSNKLNNDQINKEVL
jgi:hypothetical protein